MSNIDKVKSLIADAAVYVHNGEEGYRINYTDENSFNATSEESGEEVDFLYTEVDLDCDLIYRLQLMNP